jgi:hypothetical protein
VFGSCNGERYLWLPVRPIALTLCDAVKLLRHSKVCAVTLFTVAAVLLFSVHLIAHNFGPVLQAMVYALVKSYVSKLASDYTSRFVLQLVLSNAVFVILRGLLFYILRAVYDLGRDAVFALAVLISCLVFVGFAWVTIVHGEGLESQLSARSASLSGALLALLALLCWYWSRYMSPYSRFRRVFDYDLGAALTWITHH